MRTLFVYLPETCNHGLAAVELERTLGLMLNRRDIDHASRDFWDDDMGYAKHGVRLDISAQMTEDAFLHLLGGIVFVGSALYGSVEVQLDLTA